MYFSLQHGRFCTVQERKKQHSLPRPSKHLLLYVLYSVLSALIKKTHSTRDIISVRLLLRIFLGINCVLNRTRFQVSVLLTVSPQTAQILSPKNFLSVYEIVVGVSVGGIHALFGCGQGSRHPSRLHMTTLCVYLEGIQDRILKLYTVAVLFWASCFSRIRVSVRRRNRR
jgi:hypothetical protein